MKKVSKSWWDKMSSKPEVLKTGTTTVGLVFDKGVVLATDTRATMGYFIASKDIHKIYPITPNMAMTVAGSVGDAQRLVRLLTAEMKLYEMDNGKKPTVNAASNLLANVLNTHKFFPYFVQLLVGGVDEDGAHVFSIDMVGGVTEEKFAATGSGSPIAYGVLEQGFKEHMKEKEAVELAKQAVIMATKRDAASGENVDVYIITTKGGKFLQRESVNR